MTQWGSYSFHCGHVVIDYIDLFLLLYLSTVFVAAVNPPVIVVEPESMSDVRTRSTVTLSVDAEGLRLSFSWQRTGGRSLADDPRIEGTDTSSLRIRGAEVADSGSYVCEVSNAAGTVRSREAIISVSK